MQKAENLQAGRFLREIREKLRQAYDPREAGHMAGILFDHFAVMGAKKLIVCPNRVLPDEVQEKITEAVKRLLNFEPIQHITGIGHFCGYEFVVNPDVLIPRPETEELVRWILEDYAKRHKLSIADIGTGSGCIAISLSLRFQDAEIEAFDVSDAALKAAVRNNEELGAGVSFFKTDFLNPAQWPSKKYDIVVSNPPYIPLINKNSLPENVRKYEPAEALFVPDDDPLVFYRTLAEFCQSRLKPGGCLYAEVHENYAEDVKNLLAMQFGNVLLRRDFHDRKRMVKAVRS
jgi:release factor glutamine methyltransferase